MSNGIIKQTKIAHILQTRIKVNFKPNHPDIMIKQLTHTKPHDCMKVCPIRCSRLTVESCISEIPPKNQPLK